MVRPLLNAEGIYLSQPLVVGSDGTLRQTTRVQLEDEWDQTDGIPIPALHPGKEMGKTITYARRIDLMPFLGISGEDEDEDAPDLKPNPPFNKTFSTPAQVNRAFKPNAPQFTATNRVSDVAVLDSTYIQPEDIPGFKAQTASQVAEEIFTFVPLTKERNDQIQARLAELVKAKTLDRRKLAELLETRHAGKRAFEVPADKWEETIGVIEKAVLEGEASIKALLKKEKSES